MIEDDPFAAEADDGTVFRDLVMLALLCFVIMVVMMLPHLAPPTKGEDETRAAGNLIVEARWPDALDADVDLWVQAPGDKPVGYNAKNGKIFDLLRDDLGFERDATGLNYEFAFSRGAPAGEYVVNLHLYSSRASSDIPVRVVVSRAREGSPSSIYAGTTILRAVGQEVTVVRFELDAAGLLVHGSLGDMPFPINARQP